jgi:hypothetical protein
MVWKPSGQEIPGSFHMLSLPPPNYRLLLVISYYIDQTQFLLAPTVIRPVSNSLLSICGPWENTALLKCRHPHCVALSFYLMFLNVNPCVIQKSDVTEDYTAFACSLAPPSPPNLRKGPRYLKGQSSEIFIPFFDIHG